MKLNHRFCIFFVTVSLPAAAESAQTAVPNLTNSFLSVLLSLGIVIGVILVCVWVLKRLSGNSFSNDQTIEVLSNKLVGQKERLMVVRVAGKTLLLGVTANNINKLQDLPEDFLPKSDAQKVTFQQAFSEQITKMMGSNRNA